MDSIFVSLAIGIVLVLIVSMVYYEILYYAWSSLQRFHIAPRKRILIIVLAIFIGHCLAVYIYALSFWVLATQFQLGAIAGQSGGEFIDYLYLSVSVYSSLGVGDIFPTEGLRLIAGLQVLNGLVLIGWSVSFTYLAMEKFWDKKK